MPTQIIIGIPGLWESRSQIVQSIASPPKGYLFAGRVLMKIDTKEHWELQVAEHDPKLRRAFEIAGQGKLGQPLLDKIAAHTHVLYALSDTASTAQARAMLLAVTALLDAGGLAVKIESSGTAHSPEAWREFASIPDVPWTLYRAYVVLVGDRDNGEVYSCGMHHFQLPDVTIPITIAPEAAAELINRFNLYQLAEKPNLKPGHTFSVAPDQPRYRLSQRPCSRFAADVPFHNRAGYWHLTAL